MCLLLFFPLSYIREPWLFTNSELRKHKIIICKRMFTQRNSLGNVTWWTQLRFFANLFRGEPSKWEKRLMISRCCRLKTSAANLTQKSRWFSCQRAYVRTPLLWWLRDYVTSVPVSAECDIRKRKTSPSDGRLLHGSLHENRYNHLKISPTHNAIKLTLFTLHKHWFGTWAEFIFKLASCSTHNFPFNFKPWDL